MPRTSDITTSGVEKQPAVLRVPAVEQVAVAGFVAGDGIGNGQVKGKE